MGMTTAQLAEIEMGAALGWRGSTSAPARRREEGRGGKGGGDGGAWDNRSMRHEIIPWRTAHGSKIEAGRTPNTI